MNEHPNGDVQVARVWKSLRISWIWIIPAVALFALATVVWERVASGGPTITIVFNDADGITAGSTRIRHRSVDIGTVENVELNPDLSKVIVTARMNRRVASSLTAGTRFWIVRPQVSALGVSGLETIVSGAYIQMDPGKNAGPRVAYFQGLDQQPIPDSDVAGTSFILHAEHVHGLGPGTPIYFRGVPVGEIATRQLVNSGAGVDIRIFIRFPFDKLVHPESLFWNVSGLALSIGAEGLRATAAPLGTLLSGGISFYTPGEALSRRACSPLYEFRLFDDEAAARAAGVGLHAYYTIQFPGSVQGLNVGAPVQLLGLEVGRVSDVHLEYDRRSGTLRSPVTIELEPKRITGLMQGEQSPKAATDQLLGLLVHEGLKARLTSASLLTGQRMVSLEFPSQASRQPPVLADTRSDIPTVSSEDLEDLTRSAREAADNLNRLITSPEVNRSLKSLQETLANLDQASRDLKGGTQPLIQSLRQASDSAHRTLDIVGSAMDGGQFANEGLPRLINQLSEAARSIRLLADYLEAHPDALLRGRSANSAKDVIDQPLDGRD
jgi:paraquat-inducible protein B